MSLRAWLVLSFSILAVLMPLDAWPHAFGQRYDLPLPLSLYLWSAGFAVALSFVIAVLFLRVGEPGQRRWTKDVSHTVLVRAFTAAPVRRLLEFCSLFLFTLVFVTGFGSEQDPSRNFAPIFVWVIWWVGLAYISAFLGNFWDLVNPWKVLYRYATFVLPQLARPLCEYPERFGTWPAVLLFLGFAWLEFISGVAQQPVTLAWLVTIYSIITFAGMRVYGIDSWLRNGECFNVVFGLMARFGLFRGDGRYMQLRPPGVGLLSEHPVSLSLMAFTVLMLTTVSFDGFIETPFWSQLNSEVYSAITAPGSILSAIEPAILQQWILSVALLLFYIIFLSVYLGFSSLVYHLSSMETSTLKVARVYVLALVPIAIAYHLAHYLSYLMIAGQLMIPILSDPLGLGWDLLGTAAYKVDISVIDAQDVWYLSVCAIVIGHVAAVCIAHATSLRREESVRTAVFSQLPMLMLMVTYTMVSLWILSQPIIV